MDTIGEFLTRVRNAGQAKHSKVDIPDSNMRKGIATILKSAGYIRGFKCVKDSKQGMMRVYLRYDENGKHAIETVQRVSRPGLRRYLKANEIPRVRSGYGLAIVSTSQGIMSGEEAAKKNLGGEYLCKVW